MIEQKARQDALIIAIAMALCLFTVSCVTDQSRRQAIAWTELGNAWAELERWDKAGQAWSKAMSLDPGQLVASYNLARALAEAGKYDESIAKSDEFLAIDPDNAAVLSIKAYALHKAGRDDDAITTYQKVVRLNGGDLPSVYNLALLLEAVGRVDEAMIRYDQILLIEADHAGASYRKGLILASRGETEAALPLLLRYVEANPKSSVARTALGLAQERFGSFNDAIESYKEVLTYDEKNADASFALARVYLTKIEDGTSGLDALKRAILNGFKDATLARTLLEDPHLVAPEAVKVELEAAGLLSEEEGQTAPDGPSAP